MRNINIQCQAHLAGTSVTQKKIPKSTHTKDTCGYEVLTMCMNLSASVRKHGGYSKQALLRHATRKYLESELSKRQQCKYFQKTWVFMLFTNDDNCIVQIENTYKAHVTPQVKMQKCVRTGTGSFHQARGFLSSARKKFICKWIIATLEIMREWVQRQEQLSVPESGWEIQLWDLVWTSRLGRWQTVLSFQRGLKTFWHLDQIAVLKLWQGHISKIQKGIRPHRAQHWSALWLSKQLHWNRWCVQRQNCLSKPGHEDGSLTG